MTSLQVVYKRMSGCLQVAVVQFSNDVQVEVAPQHMDIHKLKKRLDDMVSQLCHCFLPD